MPVFGIRYLLFVYSVFVIRYSCSKIFVIFGIRVFELFSDLYVTLHVMSQYNVIAPSTNEYRVQTEYKPSTNAQSVTQRRFY